MCGVLGCVRLLIHQDKLYNNYNGLLGFYTEQVYTGYRRREDTKMSKTKIRIKLKAFEHKNLDKACAKIVETVKRNGLIHNLCC